MFEFSMLMAHVCLYLTSLPSREITMGIVEVSCLPQHQTGAKGSSKWVGRQAISGRISLRYARSHIVLKVSRQSRLCAETFEVRGVHGTIRAPGLT